GLLQLDDGSFVRGSLERKDEAVVVQSGSQSKSVAPWQIETLHIDAPVFIRGELRHLDGLEGRVASALEPGSKATREAVVGLFLEVHRQRERWTQLEALCSAAELPGDPKPQKRIESIRSAVGKLLEPSRPARRSGGSRSGPRRRRRRPPRPLPCRARSRPSLRRPRSSRRSSCRR